MKGRAQRSEFLAELGVVLERLWVFYEAMRLGQPLVNADESLAQLGTALKQGTQHIYGSTGVVATTIADPRDAEAC